MKTNDKGSTKPSVKKNRVSFLVTMAAALALTIGAASYFAFSGSDIKTSDDQNVTQQSSQSQTGATTATAGGDKDTYTISTFVSWRKAGIGEYEVDYDHNYHHYNYHNYRCCNHNCKAGCYNYKTDNS